MGSEQAEVKCDFCGYEYPSVRRSCPKCSQHGPTGNPFRTQAEVVGESGWTVKVDGLSVAWFAYPDHAMLWAHQNYHGRHQIIPSESPATKRGCGCPHCTMESDGQCRSKNNERTSPCSSGSEGGGSQSSVGSDSTTSESSSSNKPTTEESVKSGATNASTVESGSNPPAWATPQILAACKPGERLWRSWHTPDQVRAYPSRQTWDKGEHRGLTELSEEFHDKHRDECYTIPTPPPDKPKPDDAEEVADTAILHYESHTGRNTYCRGVLVGWVAAAIRADRQKHADLAGKVRELCEEATNDCHPRTLGHLAREVLAMMEER